ncbi:MAG TPA: RNA pyrophosphohydrolase [Methylocella sp.]|nr:RNA pyrophosphohydrolase [Methylocella sp.]
MDILNYRPCVGIMLFNHAGLVFIGRRRAKAIAEHLRPDYEWQMPQGGIDEGEEPYQAALRELHEETNISSTSFLAESPEWLSYDLPPDTIKKGWKSRYQGQRQKWFALRFEGQEQEINIEAPGDHAPEFDAWRWEEIHRLPTLIVPFKRAVYEQVVATFAHLAKN